MQILCKTTPIQLARHCGMEPPHVQPPTPHRYPGAIRNPPQSLCHYATEPPHGHTHGDPVPWGYQKPATQQ